MVDDSSMKMETLKKAYAEIILNTSKEAAAKIMVADRRAKCFQKDLNAVKEEALRMLVQLKQMLDFKVAEAEAKSENQQRKIDELEAQLSEAEGIIVDLREELRMTQDKLEDVKYSKYLPFKQQTSEDQQLDNASTAKTATDKCPLTENTCEDQVFMSAGELPTKPFLPSILSRAVKKQSTEMPSKLSVKTSIEHCSSSSSEPDGQDTTRLISNGSEAKSFRDGSRRNRKNLKYQEAIAALRKSSHGKNKPSVQLPSLSRCRTKTLKQNKSLDHNHDNAQENSFEFGEIPRSREMVGNTAEKESDDEETAVVFNRADSEKAIKFTFQRKRKRELLEKEDDAKLQKSGVKDEQTKDGTQLLQIAHQLISLSGNGHS